MSTVPHAPIVDDDPIILLDLDGILTDAGFRCYEADHGDAARAMLPAHADNITLLFSDVEMPGNTNGFALARHVAATYPWIEIVIASGRIEPEEGDMPERATFLGTVQRADGPRPFAENIAGRQKARTIAKGSVTGL
jgi:CheY-like chemotaxis protein